MGGDIPNERNSINTEAESAGTSLSTPKSLTKKRKVEGSKAEVILQEGVLHLLRFPSN
jgi:hypothetical protein